MKGFLVKHTFSIPKNLSLPSGRIGPAFCNILTKGVISGSGSSTVLFFDFEGLVPGGLVAPYDIWRKSKVRLIPEGHSEQEQVGPTELDETIEGLHVNWRIYWQMTLSQTFYQITPTSCLSAVLDVLGECDCLLPLCAATSATRMQEVVAQAEIMRYSSLEFQEASDVDVFVLKAATRTWSRG